MTPTQSDVTILEQLKTIINGMNEQAELLQNDPGKASGYRASLSHMEAAYAMFFTFVIATPPAPGAEPNTVQDQDKALDADMPVKERLAELRRMIDGGAQ